MALGDITFGATNLKSGADADKPISCKAGDLYIATDTNKTYVCYHDGMWQDITPKFPVLAKDGASIMQQYSVSDDVLVEDATTVYATTYDQKVAEFTVPEIVFQGGASSGIIRVKFTLQCADGGRTIYGYIRKNGVATNLATSSRGYGSTPTEYMHDIDGWEEGDTIEFWTRCTLAGSSTYATGLKVCGVFVTPVTTPVFT